MPAPEHPTPYELLDQEPATQDIADINHGRALYRQEQTSKPQPVHSTLPTTHEPLSHW